MRKNIYRRRSRRVKCILRRPRGAILFIDAQVTAIGTHAAWRRLARKAPLGATRPDGTVRLDLARDCLQPRHAEKRYWNSDATQHRHAVFSLPCRKCAKCLRRRSRFWAARVTSEIRASQRTWFVTLTISPDARSRFAMVSHKYQRERGVSWAELSEASAFAALHRTLSREVTLWMKRVRERAEGPLRYAIVCEQHKDGYPHFHAVIHEPTGSLVRYREIAEPWPHGFVHAKLVQEDGAAQTGAYVAKYLSKSPHGRLRASRGYGHANPKLPQHRMVRSTPATDQTGNSSTHTTTPVLLASASKVTQGRGVE